MRIKYDYTKKNVLFISDSHIPYHHKDAFRFLKSLQEKYDFDDVWSVGDLSDFHAISFHKSDPDLKSAGDELRLLQEYCRKLYALFPEMIIVGSNHGDLPLRKFFDAGLPKDLLRPFHEIHGVGTGWKFVDDLTVVAPKAPALYMAHGISKNAVKLAAQRGVHHVCGHYHTRFALDWVSNPQSLLWGMNSGCLIDRHALAFAYDKLNLDRPIIGCGGFIDGQPKMFPMQLNSDSRWTGVVP